MNIFQQAVHDDRVRKETWHSRHEAFKKEVQDLLGLDPMDNSTGWQTFNQVNGYKITNFYEKDNEKFNFGYWFVTKNFIDDGHRYDMVLDEKEWSTFIEILKLKLAERP